MSITFQGSPVSVSGTLPQTRQIAPNFTLCAADLSDITLESLKGQKVVLNIFLSIDTPVCASSVRTFNEKASALDNVTVLCISADLPFATDRFCGAEGIEGVKTASCFRSPSFTEDYGVNLNQGALKGLATRAVLVVNEEGIIVHSELVSEITEEPNYEAAIAALG
ncbi:thiol peroxidase (atypical 2-Cys peroxiredoxin) [Shewanella psychrophila]|uniref:Thiol peroxidase n=1 Tax=Shewanella psychrophila TaxID=225848 RepID=A0A1S6HNZ3_9GAMM|nr:thiol peroxidase [Shewanella psychrophila]AQS37224.1 thiol peroxidase (atypical 2-Cys peroxiredoxin) [Shewanella psychrophila]